MGDKHDGGRDPVPPITDRDDEFDRLIEQSSLGTPGARSLRRRVTTRQVDAVWTRAHADDVDAPATRESLSGGNKSAFGYRYQYLGTAERFLRFLREHLGELADVVLHVEPTALSQGGVARDDDIVDFAIELDTEIVERYQVKGSSNPKSNQLYPGEADRVFERLDGKTASRSILLTNRPPSSGLRERCSRLAYTSHQEQWAYDRTYRNRHSVPNDKETLIVVDERSVGELTASIAELVRQFRSDQALGQGGVTSRIISKLLLDNIFRSAAGDGPSRFEALDIVKLISTPDPAIAHAVGNFDWGVPVSGIPMLTSTVPRLDLLNTLFAGIGHPSNVSLPNIVVATGQTGFGKSALAADFCHLYRNEYEFLCWIDCSDPFLVEANVRRIAEELTRTSLPLKVDPSERFRAALASHRGPWLIVFDGVTTRSDVGRFVPTQGNGSVLAHDDE